MNEQMKLIKEDLRFNILSICMALAFVAAFMFGIVAEVYLLNNHEYMNPGSHEFGYAWGVQPRIASAGEMSMRNEQKAYFFLVVWIIGAIVSITYFRQVPNPKKKKQVKLKFPKGVY